MGSIAAGIGTTGYCAVGGTGRIDENLSVFVSDLHVGGANPRFSYTHDRLSRVVDEILGMSPRPKRVVCFGDVALSYGLAADYAASRPSLRRILDAGIELHMTMGNHDRRSNFLKHWPDYAENQIVPGRVTRVVSLGCADLVLLDTLKGTDDRAENDMGPVEGTIDAPQLAWLEDFVAKAKRPFFVGSHQFRDLRISGASASGLTPKISCSGRTRAQSSSSRGALKTSRTERCSPFERAWATSCGARMLSPPASKK